MTPFSLNHFQDLLSTVTDTIGDKPLNQDLEDTLNKAFPPDGDIFKAIESACHTGIEAQALCQHEAGGIRYGRAIKACDALRGFSVDLVHMNDLVGPHHRHPLGEIDLIMPNSENATFDGRGAGWLVYAPDSAHSPVVSDGDALVLYLLPSGQIEFTRG